VPVYQAHESRFGPVKLAGSYTNEIRLQQDFWAQRRYHQQKTRNLDPHEPLAINRSR
jgi:hypothetical protein